MQAQNLHQWQVSYKKDLRCHQYCDITWVYFTDKNCKIYVIVCKLHSQWCHNADNITRGLLLSRRITNHSAERCISPPPFFFHPPPFLISPLSLETCNPPPLPPSWRPSRENTRFYGDTPESGRLKTINIKPAVGTGCNFPHREVGTKSHHIKTYHNRLTIS